MLIGAFVDIHLETKLTKKRIQNKMHEVINFGEKLNTLFPSLRGIMIDRFHADFRENENQFAPPNILCTGCQIRDDSPQNILNMGRI